MPVNETTPDLGLELPHVVNSGEHDVERVRNALGRIDTLLSAALDVEWLISLTAPSGDAEDGAGIESFVLGFTVEGIDVSMHCATAPTGSALVADVNGGGASILGNKLTIDAGETSTDTAATPPTVITSSLAAGTVVTLDVDQIGATTPGAGVKVRLRARRVVP
ncbi:MAG: hypothetical protein AAFX65_10610 [Cyanobacteria bacterium J06638_7]